MSGDIETADLYSEALAIEVPFLKKQARLIARADASGQHISVPMVRIRRAPQGGFELDPSFVPPSVTIGAAPALGAMLTWSIPSSEQNISSSRWLWIGAGAHTRKR